MFDDDAAFFDPADFGSVAVINGGRIVSGLLDLDASLTLGVDAQGAAFTCLVSDAPEPGDALVCEGVDYRVAERLRSDGRVGSWRLHVVAPT